MTAGFSTLVSAIPGGVVAIGTLAAAEGGLVAIGASVTKSMADQAQAINTVAAASGLTSTQVQEYTRLSEENGRRCTRISLLFSRDFKASLGNTLSAENPPMNPRRSSSKD